MTTRYIPLDYDKQGYNEPDPAPPEMPLAFDEDGRPVPVEWNPIAADPDAPGDGMDPEQLLTVLLTGARSAKDAGEHVLLVGYVRREFVPTAPQTLRELGQRLGISHVMAGRKVNKFLADLRREYANFTRQG